MAYNTNIYFLLFLPIVMLAYQLTPQKYRWVALLGASVAFFAMISKCLIGWALVTAAITYYGGRLIEQYRQIGAPPKGVLRVSLILVVGILAVLKYTNFTIGIVNQVIAGLSGTAGLSFVKMMVPIGISFYTLQAVGYLLDIYWKRIEAEHNFAKVLLFLIFFPTVMEGPICRWSDVKDQLFVGEALREENITQGLIRIVWGLFKRMLIADRLYAAISLFYKPTMYLNGIMVFICMFLTTIQLYMEFSGTIDIVIGSARIFNIRLPENFRQPFLAKSAAEFWRRWHISLGTWFKNYIFYPVTTSDAIKKWNRYGKKHVGKYLTNVVTSAAALFPVWMLNGLWHGPQATYILYGVYYFIVLLAEVMLEPAGRKVYARLGWSEDGALVNGIRMVRTWCIILVGEMLFRAQSFAQFITLMKNMFVGPWDGGAFTGKLVEVGLDAGDYFVVVIGMMIVFILEWKMEKKPDMLEILPELSTAKRWLVYYGVIMAIVVFGAYGDGYQPADLIYAGF
ncbi:MAG: MBOAT family protein [Lachnospiraceae bacterium]|nr:MBOAT family protein [Lachnospiraceae bacterium]